LPRFLGGLMLKELFFFLGPVPDVSALPAKMTQGAIHPEQVDND
jgi:hypothetical protein